VSTETIYLFTTWALPVLIAITFHEAAHGFVAHRLGDDTAWQLGRVTLNPIKHIDPFGTILLPGMLLLLTRRGFSATPSRCRCAFRR
jgi:Zn-dependent protease